MVQKSEILVSAQRSYVNSTGKSLQSGIVVPTAFIQGVRHIGYKTNVEAIAELVDNSIQAYAERIDLVFGYGEGSNKKPKQLAVMDDGHGMTPDMIRLAMMWGGTHRENDRNGLGRFGYGLPCATVSLGRRITIFSKLKRGKIYATTLDLDLLCSGDEGGISIAAAQPASLPPFLLNEIDCKYPDGWESGTIILVEKLDRLDWTTSSGLSRNLTREFGVSYHKLLGQTSIYIDGAQVKPIDPLFLNPLADLHATDVDRAVAFDPVRLTIDSDETCSCAGDLTIRYAWLPPSFAATDKSRDAVGINANARFAIIKQYHGIVFSRNGRVIDVKSRTPWTIFVNNDRYIRIEIEFSASLDEEFGVTTSKQQVTVAPQMWDRLRTVGLHKAIEHLRSKVREAKAGRKKDIQSQLALLTPATKMHASLTSPYLIHPEQASVFLTSLLSEIEGRSAAASAEIQREYRELLNDWKLRISGITQGPA